MYQNIDNTLVISVNDWCRAGLTVHQFRNDSKRGLLKIFRRGTNGNTLIDVRSIRRSERLKVLEAAYGKIDDQEHKSIFRVDAADAVTARNWYAQYRKPDGSVLTPEKIEEYVNRSVILEGLRRGLEKQTEALAKSGQKLRKKTFWPLAVDWFLEQVETWPCQPVGHPRTLERLFKDYVTMGYEALIHKNTGNDSARVVSTSLESLLVSIWRTNDKPFIKHVHQLYLEFIAGNKELYDKSTGEVFRPEDFRHKHRRLTISEATVWNYLKDVVNETAAYATRNGNFDYLNSRRPKHHRKPGMYSLSKVSMDDVCISRKSTRGWVYRYISIDVVSGYWFRPAYVVGKPTHDTVLETFRNMFCELEEMGLPSPGEVEVENHLMKDLDDILNSLFPFVRFCKSPTEKRAEHGIKAQKYGAAKRNRHTRGRWYAKHEAWRTVRNKKSGDFVEPEYQPQTIVADDLADIEDHNNELHPLQNTYPGMTRKDVFIHNYNPNLTRIEPWYLYRFIGNETQTTIYNNDYVPVQGGEYEITDFEMLKRLSPNNRKVTAYWLPSKDGSIERVYLYQGDTYIGEAVDRSLTDYNECAIERTQADEANILHQNKRLAKFDSFFKKQKSTLHNIDYQDTVSSRKAEMVDVDIVPDVEPEEDMVSETNDFWDDFNPELIRQKAKSAL